MAEKNMWINQEILYETYLFGKWYYWMRDVDGTIYLAKKGENGQPKLV